MPLRIDATDMTWGLMMSAQRVLYIADRAFRENRVLARMMPHDADILRACKIREYTATALPWVIEPEDPEDPQQAAECAAITKAIQSMRRVRQFLGHLQRAFWFGHTGAAMMYAMHSEPIVGMARRDPNDPNSERVSAEVRYAPSDWLPIHGDALTFTADGRLCVRTNGFSDRWGGAERIQTPDGYAVLLTPAQREAVVLNVWNREPPEYDDPTTAARVWGGQGLRSLLWYHWVAKQHLAQNAAHYAERFARGTLMWMYSSGSAAGKDAAEEGLRLMSKTWATTVPIAGEMDPKKNPIQFMEASGTGYQIFADLERLASERITKAILHQELTSEAGPAGIGSGGVAKAHQDTFRTVIEYDAETLADSLTAELVRPMCAANFKRERRYRFCFPTPDDEGEKLARFETAYRMGVTFAEREVRQLAGGREPQGDEPVVGGGGGMSEQVDDLDRAADAAMAGA